MLPNDGDQRDDLPIPGEDMSEDIFYSGPVDASHFPPYFTGRELQFRADYDWCLRDPDIQQRYAGQVVAASQGRILGVGKNHLEALQAAQRSPGCPPRDEIALVYIEANPPHLC